MDNVDRRTLIKAAGLGAVGLGTAAAGVGLPATATAAPLDVPSPRARPRAATNDVNLMVLVSSLVIDENGGGVLKVTCGNLGPNPARGPVSLKFVTPFFINCSLPTGRGLAGGTAAFLYENPAPHVPSVLQVKFNGFPIGGTAKVVEIPVHLASTAEYPFSPNRAGWGRVIFTVDEENDIDFDTDLYRVCKQVLPVRESLSNPTPGNVNLNFTYTMVDMLPGGNAHDVPFVFQNKAATATQGTRSDSFFVFATPFYTRVPTSGRPADFTTLYENDDPGIPSVYQLKVGPGLGRNGLPLNPGRTINIPFQIQAGAPPGALTTMGSIFPSGQDRMGDLSGCHHPFMLLSNLPGLA